MGYNGDEYDDEQGDEYDDGPQPVRQVLKQREKELRELKAALKEQAAQIAEFQTQTRGQTLNSLLAAKGVDSKVSGLIPSSVEATEASVTAWLEQYGDVLNITRSSDLSTESGQETAASARLDEESDNEAVNLNALWAQAQAATRDAASLDAPALAADAISKIRENATSFDEATKMLGQIPGIKVGNYQS